MNAMIDDDAPPPWPPGPGAMAERVRTLDWRATPLGPRDQWSANLRAAVEICLDSALPMAVLWGPALIVIPNDALAALSPANLPSVLGRPYRDVQPQAWAVHAPRLARLLETGEAQTVAALWRPAGRADGAPAAATVSFTCTALRDETGGIAGMLACGIAPPARDVLERLAHELRGPLAPIRSSLELLRMSRDGLEVALVHEMLERQIHAMVQVIDGLLEEPAARGEIVPARRAADVAGAKASATTAPPVSRSPTQEAARPAGAPGGIERRKPPTADEPALVGWPRRRRLAERPPVRPVDPGPTAPLGRQPDIARRVLVVDDHHDAADSLALLLTHLGTEAKVAYDGASALEMLGDWRPEAVLLDLEMPGMDGFEVARRIRAMPRLHGLPLIALTGLGQGTDMQRTREAGIGHHLVKPVRLDVLVEVLASLDGLDDEGDEVRH
jgi:CheY-like chemotaxis protein